MYKVRMMGRSECQIPCRRSGKRTAAHAMRPGGPCKRHKPDLQLVRAFPELFRVPQNRPDEVSLRTNACCKQELKTKCSTSLYRRQKTPKCNSEQRSACNEKEETFE